MSLLFLFSRILSGPYPRSGLCWIKLSDENERLLKKLKKLQTKNKELENNLAQIQEKLRLQQLMRDYVTNRDLLQMYNNLQKRFVKEIKTNQEQSEAIANLTIKIHELEHNLQEQRQRIEQLERKKVSWKTGAVSRKRSQTPEKEVTSCKDVSKKKESCCTKYLELLLKEIKKLKKENEKLSTERRTLKNELAGLDKDFFEEIEDLKHAVQESVKLNNQYEKCLKQITVMYGLPFTAHL
ncbi:centrosomal protein of 290 kDa-like isoform X3 [Cygnus olor]|uniref:centrosomal protein of 290 kDa-like isoform X3 n=1 Tax=Cygnus olor TaxID=8869 RepID=UPI001ADE5FA7|nr:centrosomal protein of 290 kDa-like isoform X3 [Cygnus olor]